MESSELRRRLLDGLVIPAHPLALTEGRKLDDRRQRALTRYYCAAGAGGLAVGAHTTQFAIREVRHNLFYRVLDLAAKTARGQNPLPVLVAGICGLTRQAVREAEAAKEIGYDAGLVSLADLQRADDDALVDHCREVSQVLPVFGFYLQEAVGGRALSLSFWRRFCEIPNVVAIKIAPFNRYQTLDVVRAVTESGRSGEIALYTGNDDNILMDLLSRFRFGRSDARIVGGLLGQWAVGTRRAVTMLEAVKHTVASGPVPEGMLADANALTDTNAALFDAANGFRGCIPGIHEILRRQGLLAGRWCLDPHEELSPGQLEEIDRVHAAYPHLHDDDFILRHLDEWLR